ncbi:MAG: HAMP domain-containing histidine kinase [Oscillatoriophycideae cyanobacterium NC_groundwater_1537_Pr4_S-0.65um_50_18]|nr:HAMP domain-containing histidine kinase [Oscillatoriophycideae cyanobacterium NC_groundwater_1537_Pr4_S-0.65um_50_18]
MHLKPFKAASVTRDPRVSTLWIVLGLFIPVVILEFSTPPEYVFGYLYIGPILLATSRFSRVDAAKIILAASILTMLNSWFPENRVVSSSIVASRAIAVLAMWVTAVLSDRNRCYEEALAQQQAKLQAQEKLADVREDFVSTLTHDLKTPLLGAIETLKAFQQGMFGIVSTTQQKVLATMVRSHQTSLQLVETLLDIYRNDTEGLVLQNHPADLVALVEEVASSLTELAASRRVHLSFSYGESDFRKFLWVNGDALQLQRVFVNLITNAINHSPRGGKVEIVLESHASSQVAKVMDSGAGITEEELPHLFERFYQGHSDRHAKGSGLGLYLTRQIIEAHGGTIWAENRVPHGASFGFRLPAYPYSPASSLAAE